MLSEEQVLFFCCQIGYRECIFSVDRLFTRLLLCAQCIEKAEANTYDLALQDILLNIIPSREKYPFNFHPLHNAP